MLFPEGVANLAAYLFDVAEIEFTAAQARSSHANEGDVGLVDGGARVRRGMETASCVALGDQIIHSSFKYRAAA